MIITQLHDNWKMRKIGSDEFQPAIVPGSVYNDLLLNGLMEDPYYRDNEKKALAVMEDDFEYDTCFDVTKELLAEEQIMLCFEGIDTVADIYLNGEWIAYVENMHRTWEFPVKELLKEHGNTLKVVLHSPTKYIREANEKEYIPGTTDAMRGFPHLRKAHCMFGWDWGPRLPDAGIWREVKLIGYTDARIDSVYITQKHEEEKVTLLFDVDVDRLREEQLCSFGRVDEASGSLGISKGRHRTSREKLAGLSVRVKITDPDGNCQEYDREELQKGIVIEQPQLWWPNGFGSQPLYEVEVQLQKEDQTIDTWKRRIGLRTLTVSTDKDQYGEEFCHVVNGVKIFAMGSDYIPEDNILSRVTKERTRNLLQQAKDANLNSIRVWGGGYYPDDFFWDACDELGFIVWEDFMFACAVYNLTEEFEKNITAEFIDNIKRIRHHACLGLWCGNNEMEMFVDQGGEWISQPKQKTDYVKMYEYILPKICKEYDPNTFYWPSSPSSGGAFDAPGDENRGDVHYWDVWHGNKPITEYRKFYFRYLSEFGFQAFPSYKTCETFTEEEDRNIFSYVMEKHQRNSSANGKIMNYMEQTFLYPTNFSTILYASQLLQAEAIRYGVEHYRRNRGRCMGTIIWQLNDCWPVASWSSIDYCGRWKALHYYMKRFFAPVLISCAEEGILTQDTNPNAEPYEVRKSIHLNVANETMKEICVTVKWALRDTYAKILRQGEKEINVPALSSVWLPVEDMQDADLYQNYVSYECLENGSTLSEGTVLFTAPKQFRFVNPKLTVRVEDDVLVIHSEAYAKSVEICNEADDMLLEDNYFDMNAGEKRVRILKGIPNGLMVRSVYDIR